MPGLLTSGPVRDGEVRAAPRCPRDGLVCRGAGRRRTDRTGRRLPPDPAVGWRGALGASPSSRWPPRSSCSARSLQRRRRRCRARAALELALVSRNRTLLAATALGAVSSSASSDLLLRRVPAAAPAVLTQYDRLQPDLPALGCSALFQPVERRFTEALGWRRVSASVGHRLLEPDPAALLTLHGVTADDVVGLALLTIGMFAGRPPRRSALKPRRARIRQLRARSTSARTTSPARSAATSRARLAGVPLGRRDRERDRAARCAATPGSTCARGRSPPCSAC